MGKELRDGKEYFDGDPVAIYEGRFSGPFVIEEDDGCTISNGDLVTFIVTARVDVPKFSYTKTGDLKRSNTMKIVSVTPMDSDKAAYVYDNAGVSVQGVNDGIVEVLNIDVQSVSIDEIIEHDTLFNKEAI
jgi:hypothetical protein